jgi:VWFA-related protein
MKAFTAAISLLLAAQQTPPPAFKSGVALIEVDVVVTDHSGRPVRGLVKEDFVLTEDGTPVDVTTFSAVDVADAPREAPIPEIDRSGSARASNDQPQDGRVILIVLDDGLMNLSAGRMVTVKSIARRAVAGLGPSDFAAVITTSGKRGGQTEFTSDKSRLLAAINDFVPRSEYDTAGIAGPLSSVTPAQSQGERLGEVRIRASMAGLTSAVKGLASVPHRRKSVLYVSQGFPGSLEEIIKDPRVGDAWESIREFFQAAQQSNVAIYAVDPCGLQMDAGCTSNSRQNLRTIAENTGGVAFVNTNSPELGVERMLAESGAYYFITYNAPALRADGKYHRIKVTTRRPGLEVRARDGYWLPAKSAKAAPEVTSLDALIVGPLQTRGLTMRLAAIPAPLANEPSAAVIVALELPSAAAGRAGRVDFTVVAIDGEGKTRARLRFNTTFTPATPATPAWTHTGSRIDIPPGRYQIRVAAVGADNTQGSVFTELTVPKFDGGLGVGGLSLGAPTSATSGSSDRLRGVLPLVPFASGDLPPNVAVEAQLPIRVSSKSASNSLTIIATLTPPDGTRVQIDRVDAAAADYAKPSGRVYRVGIPQPHRAGNYRLAVDTTLGGTQVGREIIFRIGPK